MVVYVTHWLVWDGIVFKGHRVFEEKNGKEAPWVWFGGSGEECLVSPLFFVYKPFFALGKAECVFLGPWCLFLSAYLFLYIYIYIYNGMFFWKISCPSIHSNLSLVYLYLSISMIQFLEMTFSFIKILLLNKGSGSWMKNG